MKWIIKQLKTAKPLHPDHLGVCLFIAIFGWSLIYISDKVSMFDPLKAAFDDFFMTDIYYEMQYTGTGEEDKDIVIVDMTNLQTRDEIAQVITDIKSCHPRVLAVDLIFERQSFDQTDDVALVTAIENQACQQILSCKLRDYNPESNSFQDCLYSFFAEVDTLEWGYSNYRQIRMGGCTRETSPHQQFRDNTVYSLPYLAVCRYTGKEPKQESINERQIMFDDVTFPIISSDSVMQHSSLLKDKLVILGTIAEEADMHFTPIGKMAGVKVVAYSAHTYMKGGEIKDSGRWSSLLIALLTCLLAACIDYWIEQRHPIVFSIMAKICNFLIATMLIWLSFELYTKQNYNLNLVYPLLGLAMVEDVREMYSGIVKWLQDKTQWKIFEKSIYANVES